MDIGKIGLCLSLYLVMSILPAYAVDDSICIDGTRIVLYSNGILKSCNLRDDFEANGIKCMNDRPITFFDTGDLESCILSERSTIDNNNCKGDRKIAFYRNGALASCVKSED